MASPVVVKTVGEPIDSSPNHPADGAPAWCSNSLTVWDATLLHHCFSPRPCWGREDPCKCTLTTAANFTAALTFGITEVVFLSEELLKKQTKKTPFILDKNELWRSSLLPLHGPLWKVSGGRWRALQWCSKCWYGKKWDTEAAEKPSRMKQAARKSS